MDSLPTHFQTTYLQQQIHFASWYLDSHDMFQMGIIPSKQLIAQVWQSPNANPNAKFLTSVVEQKLPGGQVDPSPLNSGCLQSPSQMEPGYDSCLLPIKKIHQKEGRWTW